MAKVFDLGHQSRGETVEVTLRGSGANVMLVDSSNLSNYKARRRVSYRGGLVTRSPYRIAIPSSGRWYVIVSLDGLRGSTNAAVRMVRGALPAARQAAMRSPLAPIRQAADDYIDVDGDQLPAPEEKPYDVFVCHAFDDKEEIVRPLALALREQNLAVWYDEFELRIGDVLRRKIDEGLIRSRFGVVVLSPAFFAKGWRQYELDGLVTMEVNRDRQLILPIWHNVGQTEVMGYSPSLASKLARSTADLTVEQIAAEIAEVARA